MTTAGYCAGISRASNRDTVDCVAGLEFEFSTIFFHVLDWEM